MARRVFNSGQIIGIESMRDGGPTDSALAELIDAHMEWSFLREAFGRIRATLNSNTGMARGS